MQRVLSALECSCGPAKRATVISTPFIPRLASLLASSRRKFFQSTLFVIYFHFFSPARSPWAGFDEHLSQRQAFYTLPLTSGGQAPPSGCGLVKAD